MGDTAVWKLAAGVTVAAAGASAVWLLARNPAQAGSSGARRPATDSVQGDASDMQTMVSDDNMSNTSLETDWLPSPLRNARPLPEQQQPRKNARGRFKSISNDEADVACSVLVHKLLEECSPAENAAHLLQEMLLEPGRGVSHLDKAAIMYAVRVLQSDSMVSAVPEGLQPARSGRRRRKFSASSSNSQDDMNQDMVHEWLKGEFTPFGASANAGNAFDRTASSTGDEGFKRVSSKPPMIVPGQVIVTQGGLPRPPSPVSDVSPCSSSSSSRATKLPYKVSRQQELLILSCLEGIDNWDWDIFDLRKATDGRELQTLTWHLLHQWNLIEDFSIDISTLKRWLIFVESSYQKTPYHCSTHAADVLQTVHYMLISAGVSKILDNFEILAILLTAAVHDMGHDGFTNAFHKNAVTPRSLAFNDQSIQENYHVATLFSTMASNPELNIFSCFNQDDYVDIRRMMIGMVLATDMSKHFVLMKEFRELVDTIGSDVLEWGEVRDVLMSTVLHACDISNQAKPRALARSWAERCIAEFFKQGDREKELGLMISPQCNRLTTFLPTTQVGFIKFIVLPTYETLGDLLPTVAQTCVTTLQENLSYWQEREKNEQAAHTERMNQLGITPTRPGSSESSDSKEGQNRRRAWSAPNSIHRRSFRGPTSAGLTPVGLAGPQPPITPLNLNGVRGTEPAAVSAVG